MSTDFSAHFDGRVIVPDEPVSLPVGVKLQLRLESTKLPGSTELPSEAVSPRDETDDRLSLRAREAWLADFNAWMAAQRSRNPNFDDSRESIYPDRS